MLGVVKFDQLRFNFLHPIEIQYKSRTVEYIDVFEREYEEEDDDEIPDDIDRCLFCHIFGRNMQNIRFDKYTDLHVPQIVPVEEFNSANNTYTCWLRTTVWVVGNYLSCQDGLTKYMQKFHNNN